MASWSASAVSLLRFHECCVLFMVVAGGLGLRQGRQLRASRNFSLDIGHPAASPDAVQRHKRTAWVALIGAVLGLVSAGGILVGMYARMQT